MIQNLYSLYPHSTIAVVGNANSKEKFQGKEDFSIALNGAIDVNQKFTFHMMFDSRCPRYPWWAYRDGVIRLIGANIAREDKALYDDTGCVKTSSTLLHNEYLENNPPKPPHLFWYYERLIIPSLERANHLHHHGTVAHSAVELAFYMGASRIHLYGVELNQMPYSKYAPFMNQLISLIKKEGTLVYRVPSEKATLTEAIEKDF